LQQAARVLPQLQNDSDLLKLPGKGAYVLVVQASRMWFKDTAITSPQHSSSCCLPLHPCSPLYIVLLPHTSVFSLCLCMARLQEWTGEQCIGDAMLELASRLPRARMIITTRGTKGSVCLLRQGHEGQQVRGGSHWELGALLCLAVEHCYHDKAWLLRPDES
jgi:hypothetical protein